VTGGNENALRTAAGASSKATLTASLYSAFIGSVLFF
jgi:hypothetical protein